MQLCKCFSYYNFCKYKKHWFEDVQLPQTTALSFKNMYIGVCVFAIHGANLKLSLFNNFAAVVAKVINELKSSLQNHIQRLGMTISYHTNRYDWFLSFQQIDQYIILKFRAGSYAGCIGLILAIPKNISNFGR